MCKKSESITKLAAALVKAQSEITSITKDGNNPHFKSKYATLDNIIEETRPILAKHGLAILQMPGGDGENVIMKTMVLHESGEWMETEPLIMRPVKSDPQGMGSCITYARRYSYSSLLSISTDEDDDGNSASHAPYTGHQHTQGTQYTNRRAQSNTGQNAVPETVSEAQLKMIGRLKNERQINDADYRELLQAMYNVESTKQLTKKQASEFIAYLQKSA
jgi:Protein of unknown function (DUF1018)./ERF superfamily.